MYLCSSEPNAPTETKDSFRPTSTPGRRGNSSPAPIAGLASLAEHVALSHGSETPIAGLTVTRGTYERTDVLTFQQPTYFLVLQGESETVDAEEAVILSAGDAMITMPRRSHSIRMLQTSPQSPYLAIHLELDCKTILDLPQVWRPSVATPDVRWQVRLSLDGRLIDPLERLLALAGCPDDIPVLVPLIKREVAWHLLKGPSGVAITSSLKPPRHVQQIATIIDWMQEHFSEPLNVEALARKANMSVPSFHRHFKAVTRTSPLQYLKSLRLQDARHKVLRYGNVGVAAFDVGYESLSQFNRDYRKMFGRPPSRDAAEFGYAIAASG